MKEMLKPWFQKYSYAKTTTVCAHSVTCFQEQFQTPASTKNMEVVNNMLGGYSNQLTLCVAKECRNINIIFRNACVTSWWAVSVPIVRRVSAVCDSSCSACPEVCAVRETFMYVCWCCHSTRKALQQCVALRKETRQRGLSANLACVHKSPFLAPG